MFEDITNKLAEYSTPERKQQNSCFFKTKKGQYAENTQFIGVSMPNIRKVALQYYNTITETVYLDLLYSNIHEHKLCALVILVNQYKKTPDVKKIDIVNRYLKHIKQVNNWDLVDVSCTYIIGHYIHYIDTNSQDILYTMAKNTSLWQRRIAIVSNWIIIRKGHNITLALNIAHILLKDPEDLIHKATGWMLREAWKHDPNTVEAFLKQHYSIIHRTTLRYSIEKMGTIKRQQFLKGCF